MVMFRVVVELPARLADLPREVQSRLDTAMRETVDGCRKDFEKTTATWNNKPTFETSVQASMGGITGKVWTDSDIYRFIDQGTGPRDITPRADNPSGLLWFQENYTAKTSPGWIGSGGGGPSGAYRPAAMVPRHEIEPRHFAKTIAEEWRPKFAEKIRSALRRL